MLLKADLFGTITRIEQRELRASYESHTKKIFYVERNTRHARWWLRWLASHLATREYKALKLLNETARTSRAIPGVPRVLERARGILTRTWIEGTPMQRAQPRDPHYFREALRLLRHIHRAGIAHNDLAKEPNWLVTPDGQPALVDFQLASISPSRSRLFRMLARDDLRHLLKHKRTYCPAKLTTRQHHILATPSPLSRLWRATGKKLYRLITRRILRWADREGAEDRRWKP